MNTNVPSLVELLIEAITSDFSRQVAFHDTNFGTFNTQENAKILKLVPIQWTK